MEPEPIAVYDVEHKKLVIVARSPIILGRYCTDTPQFERHVNRYINDKMKNRTNRFNRTIAYRLANTQQRELLGASDIVIFSKEYDIDTKTKINKKISYV